VYRVCALRTFWEEGKLAHDNKIENNNKPDRWLMYKHITEITTFTRQQIYKWVEAGEFPKPFKFGRKMLWKESEVCEWMERQEGRG
jgi:excisionase family DNA binding protein